MKGGSVEPKTVIGRFSPLGNSLWGANSETGPGGRFLFFKQEYPLYEISLKRRLSRRHTCSGRHARKEQRRNSQWHQFCSCTVKKWQL